VAQGGGVGQQSGARRGHLDDQRLVFCGHCGVMFTLCRVCDRGQRFCEPCRPLARQKVIRAARRRHRATPEGRADHADHQRAYRARRAERVGDPGTAKLPDQESVCLGGSAPATAVVTLVAAAGSCPDAPDPDGRCLQAGPSAAAETSTGVRCALCGRAGRWVRHESLRPHRRSRPSCLRPARAPPSAAACRR